MSFLGTVSPELASEGAAQTLGRLKELLGTEQVPDVFLACAHVDAFLKDFYMNFKRFVYADGALDAKTKSVIALAVAVHGKCRPWMNYYSNRLKDLGGTPQEVADVVAIVSTNAMYNTFFKFRDLSGSDLFGGMAVGLRAHTFSNTSLGEKLVELINIAISDINACKPCTSGHVGQARELGLSSEQLLECIQCAATAYAGVVFVNAAL